MNDMQDGDGTQSIPSGVPSAFELGRLSGNVEALGKEIAEVKTTLAGTVTTGEFHRAFRNVTALNVLILTAIVGLAFAALRPQPSNKTITPATATVTKN